MKNLRMAVVATASLLLLIASACGDDGSTPKTEGEPTEAISVDEPTAEIEGAEPLADERPGKLVEDFDPNNFDDPTNIDNQWLPIQPGTRLAFEGSANDDEERVPRSILMTVTDLTKVVGGVRAVVVWERDFDDGELVEAELAFFAQDNDGNVWRMGEYPEEYEEGEFVEAPAWIHGLEDARAGIAMKAAPLLADVSYAQGWAPAVDWADRGQVFQLGEQTCVPVDCYEDVLVIEEFNRDEPDAYQLKYYAPGIGNVQVGWRGEGEEEQETMELSEASQLTAEELSEARSAALELEMSAYEHSSDVYGETAPME